MRITTNNKPQTKDFNMLLAEYSEKYEVIHHVQISDIDFVFRLLTRHELKGILTNPNLGDLDKEDAICSTCLLYPENFDFDDCEAGIPSELYKAIIENSFLDSVTSTLRLILHFRDEMEELDNQMACIISEAFPNYSLEEIESWNNLKFCKMFSRAEWKFKSLRNTAEIKDIAEVLEGIINEVDTDEDVINNNTDSSYDNSYEPEYIAPEPQINNTNNNSNNSKKSKMTPEKLRELEELKRKFPEINWGADEILNHGADNAMSNLDSVSTVSPALRPGWY